MPLFTKDRWRENLARCVDASGQEASIELVGFVFVPEHVHLLAYPTAPNPSIGRCLARIKQPLSKEIKDVLAQAGFSTAVAADGAGATGQELLSVLARRAGLRPQPVLCRGDLVLFGVYPPQPGQTRIVPACRGLEMVVGQILPHCASTTVSQPAHDSRLTRSMALLISSMKALAEPVAHFNSATQPTTCPETTPPITAGSHLRGISRNIEWERKSESTNNSGAALRLVPLLSSGRRYDSLDARTFIFANALYLDTAETTPRQDTGRTR